MKEYRNQKNMETTQETKNQTTESIHAKILASSIFRANGPSIDLCNALIELCNCINNEEETDWSIGEFTEASLDSLIVGAYWSLTEWHGGQESIEYAALSALGGIFNPGMGSAPDEDDNVYTAYSLINAHFEEGNH